MIAISNKLRNHGIEFERFNAIDGTLFSNLRNHIPSYLTLGAFGAFYSHLSIYSQAIDRGEKRILILEDDIEVYKDVHDVADIILPDSQYDLLYLAYIPVLNGEWNFDQMPIPPFVPNIIKATNLWSCMAYAINEKLMKHMLKSFTYMFDCEIDVYFAKYIQTNPYFNCKAAVPALFCGETFPSSDTTPNLPSNLKTRSVDARYSNPADYK